MPHWHDDDEDRDWEPDDDFDDEEPGEDDDLDEPTIACPYCRRQIHEESQRCPHCERYLSDEDAPRSLKSAWIIAGVVICLLIVARWILNW